MERELEPGAKSSQFLSSAEPAVGRQNNRLTCCKKQIESLQNWVYSSNRGLLGENRGITSLSLRSVGWSFNWPDITFNQSVTLDVYYWSNLLRLRDFLAEPDLPLLLPLLLYSQSDTQSSKDFAPGFPIQTSFSRKFSYDSKYQLSSDK